MNKISLIAAIFTIIFSYSYASYENTPKFQVSKKFYRKEDNKFMPPKLYQKQKRLSSPFGQRFHKTKPNENIYPNNNERISNHVQQSNFKPRNLPVMSGTNALAFGSNNIYGTNFPITQKLNSINPQRNFNLQNFQFPQNKNYQKPDGRVIFQQSHNGYGTIPNIQNVENNQSDDGNDDREYEKSGNFVNNITQAYEQNALPYEESQFSTSNFNAEKFPSPNNNMQNGQNYLETDSSTKIDVVRGPMKNIFEAYGQIPPNTVNKMASGTKINNLYNHQGFGHYEQAWPNMPQNQVDDFSINNLNDLNNYNFQSYGQIPRRITPSNMERNNNWDNPPTFPNFLKPFSQNSNYMNGEDFHTIYETGVPIPNSNMPNQELELPRNDIVPQENGSGLQGIFEPSRPVPINIANSDNDMTVICIMKLPIQLLSKNFPRRRSNFYPNLNNFMNRFI